MEKIRFDTEFINDYFKDKLNKEEFTIENIKSISNVAIRGYGEKITQSDLDILMELEKVSLININLEGLVFKQGGKIKFLEIVGDKKIDYKKIAEEHPEYNSLDRQEKLGIISDEKYSIYPKFKVSGLGNIQELESLKLDSFEITQNDINMLGNLRNLEKLSLSGKIDIDAEIPEFKSLKDISLSGINNLKLIKNITNIENLSVYQNEKRKLENIDFLANFKKLNSFTAVNVEEIQNYLPMSKKLKDLKLINCDISDLKHLDKYPELMNVRLEKNNISYNSIEDLKKLSNRVESLYFNNNPIAEDLKKEIIPIENREVRSVISEMINSRNNEQISQYDAITKDNDFKQNIEGKDVLETLITTGLIKKINIKNIIIEDLDGISKDTLKWLLNAGKVKIELLSFKGLSLELLKELDKNKDIQFYVEGDVYTNIYDERYYTNQDMSQILTIIDKIKSYIPNNATEKEKFMTVYRGIGLVADYDRSGRVGGKEYKQGMEAVTRSLKGVLTQGKAVCFGYSLALKKCLDYVGIHSKQIGGYVYNNPENAHSWNQVQIDGNWYNVDLTWDNINIKDDKSLDYCLVSDEKFYQDHTPDSVEKVYNCDKDYENKEKNSVTYIEFKENAENTVIRQNIVNTIKEAIKEEDKERIGDADERNDI